MNKSSQKKFRLWSDALNEENLCENILGFELDEQTKKSKNERGVESYKFENENLENYKKTSKKSKVKRLDKNTSTHTIKNHLNVKNTDFVKELTSNKTDNLPNIQLKDRLGSMVTYDETKSRSHIHVTELDSDEAVAKEIVKVLKEPKDDVIKRCVKVLGKKKCLELLFATEDVQSNGGMLTSDGYRKRTSGGVFFQLLKKDDTILNCQRSQIFLEEAIKKRRQKLLKD